MQSLISYFLVTDIVQGDLELLDQFYSDCKCTHCVFLCCLSTIKFNIYILFAVCGPLVRLSPPPGEKDYHFNLSENEGICDLFDIAT